MVALDDFLTHGGDAIQSLTNYLQQQKPHIWDGGQDSALTLAYFCDQLWLNFALEIGNKIHKTEYYYQDMK